MNISRNKTVKITISELEKEILLELLKADEMVMTYTLKRGPGPSALMEQKLKDVRALKEKLAQT